MSLQTIWSYNDKSLNNTQFNNKAAWICSKAALLFTGNTLTKESVDAIVSVHPLVTTPPIIQADTPTLNVDVIACRARIGIRCSE